MLVMFLSFSTLLHLSSFIHMLLGRIPVLPVIVIYCCMLFKINAVPILLSILNLEKSVFPGFQVPPHHHHKETPHYIHLRCTHQTVQVLHEKLIRFLHKCAVF